MLIIVIDIVVVLPLCLLIEMNLLLFIYCIVDIVIINVIVLFIATPIMLPAHAHPGDYCVIVIVCRWSYLIEWVCV